MAELKTRPNNADVDAFIESVEDMQKRNDCRELVKIMTDATGEHPVMWGPSIIGFGTYHYVYASGNEGDWMLTGFSPRKQALTLYIMTGFKGHDDLLASLGKFKTGKSCLYVKKLEDVDEKILQSLIMSSVEKLRKKYFP